MELIFRVKSFYHKRKHSFQAIWALSSRQRTLREIDIDAWPALPKVWSIECQSFQNGFYGQGRLGNPS